jgi:hypothetical protein
MIPIAMRKIYFSSNAGGNESPHGTVVAATAEKQEACGGLLFFR